MRNFSSLYMSSHGSNTIPGLGFDTQPIGVLEKTSAFGLPFSGQKGDNLRESYRLPYFFMPEPKFQTFISALVPSPDRLTNPIKRLARENEH